MTQEIEVAGKYSQSLAELQEQFAQLAEAQREAIEVAGRVNITDESSLQQGITIGKQLRETHKAIEARRKELNDPILSWQRNLKAIADGAAQPFHDAEKSVDAKIAAFNIRKDAEAEAEKARIMAELEKKEREHEEKDEVEKMLDESKLNAEREAAIARYNQTVLDSKAQGARKGWDFELVDEKLLPREVLEFSEVKARALIRAGFREIKGLRIFEKMIANKR